MSVWLLLRLVGIAIGIITLLSFASGYLHFNFIPYFADVLAWLQLLVDTIIRAEDIEWALDQLRQSYPWVPNPDEHWRPIYTLTALLLLSIARSINKVVISPFLILPTAVVSALVPAIFAGTLPLGSPAVILWPLAGLALFYSFLAFLGGGLRSSRNAILGAAILAALGILVGPVIDVDVIGMVALAVSVGLIGFALLAIALLDNNPFWVLKKDPFALAGTDILGTLGGALALGYLFAA
jgi:hypothetical protein